MWMLVLKNTKMELKSRTEKQVLDSWQINLNIEREAYNMTYQEKQDKIDCCIAYCQIKMCIELFLLSFLFYILEFQTASIITMAIGGIFVTLIFIEGYIEIK